MYKTISKSDFRDAFQRCGRGNQFSYDALGVMFDYLEEMDEGCDTDSELDPIACCCEFSEYENLEAFQNDYGKEDYETIEDVRDATTVMEVGKDGFLIAQF